MARAVSAMMAMMRVSSVRFMIVLCFRGCCGQISVFFGRWGAWGGVFVVFLGYLTWGWGGS